MFWDNVEKHFSKKYIRYGFLGPNFSSAEEKRLGLSEWSVFEENCHFIGLAKHSGHIYRMALNESYSTEKVRSYNTIETSCVCFYSLFNLNHLNNTQSN